MFYQIIFFFLFSNVLLIAAEEQTPDRASVDAALTAPETPGQLAHQLQINFFRDQCVLIQRVLGQDFVERLPSFAVLSDPDETQNPQRRRALRTIDCELKNALITKPEDSGVGVLFISLGRVNAARSAVYSTRLEELTRQYFTIGSFKGSAVDFDFKTGGDQLGAIAHVTRGPKTLTYYIKTHSEGTKSSQSSAARLLRPEELMAYKVLDLLGVGCECHFFGRDPKNFYIATLSAHHGGLFYEYSKFLEGGLNCLWGGFPLKPSYDLNATEIILQSDVVARNFVCQMVVLDLLARIMRLKDLQKNTNNFGFQRQQDNIHRLVILDFSVVDDPVMRVANEHFLGFLDGNTIFDYASAEEKMRYILHDRPKDQRVSEARNVMSGSLGDMPRAVRDSYTVLRKFFLEDAVCSDERELLMTRLFSYKAALLHNFGLFSRKLEG